MAAGGDEILEDLIKSAEEALKEAEALDLPPGSSPAVRQDDAAAIEIPDGGETDGRCELGVSGDGMTALAHFLPPSGKGEPFGLPAFEDLLASNGIRFGLDMAAVREAILRCATERVPVTGITAARGKQPEDEVSAYIVVEPGLLEPQRKTDGREAVDHKASSPFSIVRKGDVLARMIPRREGVMGTDVHGSAIPYGFNRVEYPKPGKNTSWSGEGTVIAECDGRFLTQKDTFLVNMVLDVAGDADYSTGHIEFPGDVLIRGEIKSGFRVQAGGSIWCAKVVDATDVSCAGDLVTNQGILGRGKGSVHAGGGVKARFIENCLVEAGGKVEIHVGCLNSTVRTLDRIEMGPSGVIIGGTVSALHGVAATQIGSPSGTRTDVQCGTDYVVQKKILLVRDRNLAAAFKLKNLEQLAAAGRVAGVRLDALRERLKDAIARLNEAARTLVGSLDGDESAEISVRGTAYTGTSIEICHVPYVVSAPMAHVRFRLDKAKGRIVADRIR